MLVRTMWLSFDPAQRGWLNDVRSYVPPVAIGEPMRASGIGEVVTSNAERYAPGDLVHAMVGWQEYAVLNPAEEDLFELVPGDVKQPEMMLGLLGMTALTAYFGMTEIGRPGVPVAIAEKPTDPLRALGGWSGVGYRVRRRAAGSSSAVRRARAEADGAR